MHKQVMGFADGENLTLRFQDMVNNGHIPGPSVVHEKDTFVWSPSLVGGTNMDITRMTYYTSAIASQDKLDELSARMAENRYYPRGSMSALQDGQQIIPRVFKREGTQRKTRIVDIQIAIDVMRAALTMPIDGIFLLAGDGDYLSLVHEVTRNTSKQIYVGAFSSGLAPGLRTSVDMFMDLDGIFFRTPDAVV